MGVVGFAERTLVAPGWLRRRAALRVTDRGPQIIAEAQAGDKAAFDALVGPLMEPAFRLACGILANRDDAEEAVQEAVFNAWRKLTSFKGTNIRPWFLTIVANQCRSTRRGRWWSVFKGLDPSLRAAPADEGLAQRVDLERGLRQLKTRDRTVLILHYYHDLPLDEVAMIVGLSPAGAKTRLYRAIAQLRPHMQASEVEN
jgi:RNA polymerase sigma-70 factor (ECF subfamily)